MKMLISEAGIFLTNKYGSPPISAPLFNLFKGQILYKSTFEGSSYILNVFSLLFFFLSPALPAPTHTHTNAHNGLFSLHKCLY